MSFLGRLSTLIERVQALPDAIENLAGSLRDAIAKSSEHEVSANKQEVKRAAEQQRQYRVQLCTAWGTCDVTPVLSSVGCICRRGLSRAT